MTPPPLSLSAPPPWTLTGAGYVALLRLPRGFVETRGFVPPALQGRFAGGLGGFIYADYRTSAVGPYRELLFVPGRFRIGGQRRFVVTKIYVSTEASVEAGRRNWGLPKERAQFDAAPAGRWGERLRVRADGRLVADLTLRALPFFLSFNTRWLPPSFCTLGQPFEGRTYWTTLRARGALQPAWLAKAAFDTARFPDLTQGGCVLAAGRVTRLTMHFLAPQIAPRRF